VTNDLVRRVYEHKHGKADGFTKKYGVDKLVWFETSNDIRTAIQREKTMKHWRRAWKISLIETLNPDWCDLYDGLSR
jgi:putative endonuclease